MENKTTNTSNFFTQVERIDVNTPVYAGCYQVGDDRGCMRFSLKVKPKWIHRKFCQLLLGWKWIDSINCGS